MVRVGVCCGPWLCLGQGPLGLFGQGSGGGAVDTGVVPHAGAGASRAPQSRVTFEVNRWLQAKVMVWLNTWLQARV